MVTTILTGLGIYLLLGVIALGILDLSTKRIRRRLRPASYDTLDRLAGTGQAIGVKTAVVVTSLALWLFWPVAVYGMFKGGSNEAK